MAEAQTWEDGWVGDWVVFDYGGVLCTDQPEADRRAVAAAAGVDPHDAVAAGRFREAYWAHRGEYDRGSLTPGAYWTAVLGRPPADVDAVEGADIASWSHPYEGTLALLDRLADRGTGLALLSNAPHSLAAVVDTLPWAARVPHRFYSSRLRANKPDPAAYGAVLARLGTDPARVTFVDDRPANVAGAQAVGMRALLFTDPATLAADLDLQEP